MLGFEKKAAGCAEMELCWAGDFVKPNKEGHSSETLA